MLEDSFNAVPAHAACELCRHFAISPKSGKCYCEFLDRKVSRRGWCSDFEEQVMEMIKRKNAEKH